MLTVFNQLYESSGWELPDQAWNIQTWNGRRVKKVVQTKGIDSSNNTLPFTRSAIADLRRLHDGWWKQEGLSCTLNYIEEQVKYVYSGSLGVAKFHIYVENYL